MTPKSVTDSFSLSSECHLHNISLSYPTGKFKTEALNCVHYLFPPNYSLLSNTRPVSQSQTWEELGHSSTLRPHDPKADLIK